MYDASPSGIPEGEASASLVVSVLTAARGTTIGRTGAFFGRALALDDHLQDGFKTLDCLFCFHVVSLLVVFARTIIRAGTGICAIAGWIVFTGTEVCRSQNDKFANLFGFHCLTSFSRVVLLSGSFKVTSWVDPSLTRSIQSHLSPGGKTVSNTSCQRAEKSCHPIFLSRKTLGKPGVCLKRDERLQNCMRDSNLR